MWKNEEIFQLRNLTSFFVFHETRVNRDFALSLFSFSLSLSFVIWSENDIFSDRAERRSISTAEREVGTYQGREGRTVLPTRDQHRREIASNLWVRLITGECSSFDSPLFLRPQLHQTSFQRRGEAAASLVPPPSPFLTFSLSFSVIPIQSPLSFSFPLPRTSSSSPLWSTSWTFMRLNFPTCILILPRLIGPRLLITPVDLTKRSICFLIFV